MLLLAASSGQNIGNPLLSAKKILRVLKKETHRDSVIVSGLL